MAAVSIGLQLTLTALTATLPEVNITLRSVNNSWGARNSFSVGQVGQTTVVFGGISQFPQCAPLSSCWLPDTWSATDPLQRDWSEWTSAQNNKSTGGGHPLWYPLPRQRSATIALGALGGFPPSLLVLGGQGLLGLGTNDVFRWTASSSPSPGAAALMGADGGGGGGGGVGVWSRLDWQSKNAWPARWDFGAVAVLRTLRNGTTARTLLLAGGRGSDSPKAQPFGDVWRSDDGGVTWYVCSDPAWQPRYGHAMATTSGGGGGGGFQHVFLLGGTRADPVSGAAVPFGDMWRSADGGETWVQLDVGGSLGPTTNGVALFLGSWLLVVKSASLDEGGLEEEVGAVLGADFGSGGGGGGSGGGTASEAGGAAVTFEVLVPSKAVPWCARTMFGIVPLAAAPQGGGNPRALLLGGSNTSCLAAIALGQRGERGGGERGGEVGGASAVASVVCSLADAWSLELVRASPIAPTPAPADPATSSVGMLVGVAASAAILFGFALWALPRYQRRRRERGSLMHGSFGKGRGATSAALKQRMLAHSIDSCDSLDRDSEDDGGRLYGGGGARGSPLRVDAHGNVLIGNVTVDASLLIDGASVELGARIAVGSSGQVYEGTYWVAPEDEGGGSLDSSVAGGGGKAGKGRGKLGKGKFGGKGREKRALKVAVKELMSQSISDAQGFYNEMQMLSELQQHPNVIALFGMVRPTGGGGGGGIMLVTEFLPSSLRDVLTGLMRARQASVEGGGMGGRGGSASLSSPPPSLSSASGAAAGSVAEATVLAPARLRALLVGVARGMEFIHSRSIIHRDLKPSNILVGADGTTKICDFGIARHVASKAAAATMTGQQGSPRYMAPEIIRSERSRYSNRVDVFSFGITLYECCCGGQDPYGGLTAFEIMEGVTAHGLRPNIPQSWPPSLVALLQQMWSEHPEERPEFSRLRRHLQDEDALQLPSDAPDVEFLQGMVEHVPRFSLHG